MINPHLHRYRCHPQKPRQKDPCLLLLLQLMGMELCCAPPAATSQPQEGLQDSGFLSLGSVSYLQKVLKKRLRKNRLVQDASAPGPFRGAEVERCGFSTPAARARMHPGVIWPDSEAEMHGQEQGSVPISAQVHQALGEDRRPPHLLRHGRGLGQTLGTHKARAGGAAAPVG